MPIASYVLSLGKGIRGFFLSKNYGQDARIHNGNHYAIQKRA